MNTIELLKEIELMNEKCSNIFEKIEEIETKYKTGYRERFSYDYFVVECDCISMYGSYSYSGDRGQTEYVITASGYDNVTEFLAKYEEKKKLQFQEYQKKQADLAVHKEAAEIAKLQTLLTKYGHKLNLKRSL